MDLNDLQASASIVIAAPPDKLYEFIADMPRIGEISPECIGGEWEGDARGVGATFVGSNVIGENSWQARMRVAVADPSRQFAWENMGAVASEATNDGAPNARWTYTFTPIAGGTEVEETWKMLRVGPQLEARGEEFVNSLPGLRRANMETTLAKLKALYES
jgi:hypothetical protein